MNYPEHPQQGLGEPSVMAQRLDKYLGWIADAGEAPGADEILTGFVLQGEGYPFLRLAFTTFTAQLSYLHDAEEDEDDPHGVVSIVAPIYISPYNAAWALMVCDTFNAHSLGGFAYVSPDDSAIYYRMILQDGDDTEDADNFLYFLERYQTYFPVLRELCENERQETEDESL